MFIIFDTNIWLSELALNSTRGSAVRYFARQKNARIALPYVIKLETEAHFRESLNKYVDDINKNYRQLLTIFGTLKEIILPNSDQIEDKVQGIFTGLGIEIVEIQFTLESAESSFIKIVNKEPPNGEKNQQFKDGVIWADCLKLLENDDVYLVSNDKGFYKDKDNLDKGLDENLAQEASKFKNKLNIFPSLVKLLDEIKTKVIIDEKLLINSFISRFSEQITSLLADNGFEINISEITQKSIYVTENPSVLFIDYSINCSCIDLGEGNKKEAVLRIHGDGKYNSDENSFEELRCLQMELQYFLPDGTEKIKRSSFLYASSIFLGHREVTHTVKYELD
jgi:predicted nucleic acid-binding protein